MRCLANVSSVPALDTQQSLLPTLALHEDWRQDAAVHRLLGDREINRHTEQCTVLRGHMGGGEGWQRGWGVGEGRGGVRVGTYFTDISVTALCTDIGF